MFDMANVDDKHDYMREESATRGLAALGLAGMRAYVTPSAERRVASESRQAGNRPSERGVRDHAGGDRHGDVLVRRRVVSPRLDVCRSIIFGAALGPAIVAGVRAAIEQERGEGSGRGSNRSAASVVMPEVFAEQGVTLEEYAQLTGTYFKALNPPDRWSGDEEKKGRDVRLFLNDLQSLYELSSLPPVFWGMFAGNYLGWQPKKQWSHEVSSLRVERGANYHGVSWQDFETFMRPYSHNPFIP